MPEPTHHDIDNRIGGLNERLVRVETQVETVRENERELRQMTESLRSRVNQIAEDLQQIIGEQRSTRRMVGWGLTIVTIVLTAVQVTL